MINELATVTASYAASGNIRVNKRTQAVREAVDLESITATNRALPIVLEGFQFSGTEETRR
jgi:hypothetical protein